MTIDTYLVFVFMYSSLFLVLVSNCLVYLKERRDPTAAQHRTDGRSGLH